MDYSRQEKLSFIPEDFQQNIKDVDIVLVGCGGVGSVLAELLIRGGFLNLTILDMDVVDRTNIQRQTYCEKDIGKSKASILKGRLDDITRNVCKMHVEQLSKENIKSYCESADLIIDCTDNMFTRKIINGYCEQEGKVWLYTGAVKTEFVVCLFDGTNKKFSKVFSDNVKDEHCCDVGVLASTTYAAASLAYNEVLKFFLNLNENKLIKMDLWNNTVYEVNLK